MDPLFTDPAQAKSYAQRLIEGRIKPRQPQQPCDIGLFGDDAAQLDLIDLTNRSADNGKS